ncbi:MEKHLA domain-containing protein [Roseovarius sp. EL26]|uniref:MEKHLA domain-containing protein n=1 Tax=Roseovarius sp. EL26 TaxID=2126672 RepID=UPI000EA2E151|nr:MEKHLA domain-containing protein [Roseovarius sp. EL26]
MHEPSQGNKFQIEHSELLMRSFEKRLSRPLTTSAKALYHAPFPVLSHNAIDDPVFTYGNLAAQKLWEVSWDQITQMPSRLSAETDERAARAAMLASITANGFIDDYHGIRISSSGRRFAIKNAIIWTLSDDQGHKCGQAATFNEIEFL